MSVDIDKLLAALDGEDYGTRCDALRDCCPCRNGSRRDLEVWRAVFDKVAGQPARAEPRGTCHWDIDREGGGESGVARRATRVRDRTRCVATGPPCLAAAARADEEAWPRTPGRRHAGVPSSPQGARSGVARRARSIGQRAATGPHRVTGEHPGIQRLWRWMKHRVRFQPERRTSEGELARRAARYLPRLFDTNAAATVGATLVVARPKAVHEFGTGRDKPVPYGRDPNHRLIVRVRDHARVASKALRFLKPGSTACIGCRA